MKIKQILLANLFLGLFAVYSIVYADVLIAPTPGNLLTATVQSNVTKDPNTQMYTYSYTVTNNTGSEQELWLFSVEISPDAEVAGFTSPAGWVFAKNASGMLVSWAAVDVGEIPPSYIDDGSEIPSPYNIKPGETLTGFSFQSLNGPSNAKYFAQGFTQTPMVQSESDIDDNSGNQPIVGDSYSNATTSATLSIYGGGRRPAIDGFLGFRNLQKRGNTFASPAMVSVKFSLAGEQVNRSTFRAELNNIDVTNQFLANTSLGGDLVAIFSVNESPLVYGRNVLITSVDGIVPGTTRVATDTDRLTIDIQ